MKPRFAVRVRAIAESPSGPDAWDPPRYRALLHALDYQDADGVAEADLREMVLMALQDKEPNEAAEAVLEVRLGDRLTRGQRQELSHEMIEDVVWVEFAEMSEHEDLFHASALLHDAVPDVFPPAAAVRVELEVDAENEAAREELEDVREPLLCRLLADGMTENAILCRLFEDQIGGAVWSDAAHLVWTFGVERVDAGRVVVWLVSTQRWVGDLREGEAYASGAAGDRAGEEGAEEA